MVTDLTLDPPCQSLLHSKERRFLKKTPLLPPAPKKGRGLSERRASLESRRRLTNTEKERDHSGSWRKKLFSKREKGL